MAITQEEMQQKLFESLLPSKQTPSLVNPAMQLADRVGNLGAFSAFYGDQRNKDMAQYAQNLTMGLPGSKGKVLPSQLEDMAKRKQLAKDRTALVEFIAASDSSQLSEPKKVALMKAAENGLIDTQTAIAQAYPDAKNRYGIAGNNIFDYVKNEWIAAPKTGDDPAGMGVTGLSQKDILNEFPPEQYDPVTYGRFLEAIKKNYPLEEASKLLMVEQEDGWRIEEQEGRFVPILERRSRAGVVMQSELDATNESIRQAKDKANRVQETVNRQIDRLTAKDKRGNYEIRTELPGVILGAIAGTDEYDFAADQEMLLANLGLGELRAMRAAAKNGASGLGQLTEKELSRLESLVANLNRRGQSREQLIRNLEEIQSVYDNILEIQGNYTWDEYVYNTRENNTSSSSTITIDTNYGQVRVRPAN